MLKSIKSKLIAGESETTNAPQNVEAAERKRREKQKEREALASAQEEGARVKLATKSLGSKKLATVVNRLKLITRNRHSKRWSSLKFDAHKRDHQDRKFQLALDASLKRPVGVRKLEEDHHQQQHDGELDDDCDALSYLSALGYFVDSAEDSIELCTSERETGNETGQQEDGTARSESNAKHKASYLTRSTEMLPEEQCDIPTFLHTKPCERALIDETRRLLRERHEANPESFYDHDYHRMLTDDWTVSRFLLRRRLDPKRTAKLMEECGKFRRQYLMSEMQIWEFPREFHQAGGLFRYLPDRVGNETLYMRTKMHRPVAALTEVMKAFILCILEECDKVNNGRGTAVIFDLTGARLQNVDLAFLYWLLNSFRNYCPKGVSYILVYNLPWFLSATAKLSMTWLSETNRRSLRFVSGDEIQNFIAPENLPDYLGGTCKLNYRKVPRGCRPAVELCHKLDITPEQALKFKELFQEYLDGYETDDQHDQHDQHEDTESIYGDVHEHSKQRQSMDSSSASTARVNDGDVSPDSLVPVISAASKFTAAA